MTAKPAEPEQPWPDLAGRIEGARHILPVRVYHEDTDFTGLVYHANFLKFCERGRSDLVRLLGLRHTELLSPAGGGEGAAFLVRHMEIDFLKPARMDDVLEVATSCEAIGAATLTLLQEVIRARVPLARIRVKIVLVSKSGKPQRLEGLARAALERFVNEEV